MSNTIHRRAALSVAALLVVAMASVTVGATDEDSVVGPALSAATTTNADQVDGKHAVASTYKKWQRKSKLVATNRDGYLPSNIVKPYWRLIKEMPAGFADGVDNVGYKRVTAWTGVARPWTRTFVEFTVDADVDVDFSVIPETDGGELLLGMEHTETLIERVNDKLRYRIGFLNNESTPTDVTVRARLSGTKAQLADVVESARVSISREPSR